MLYSARKQQLQTNDMDKRSASDRNLSACSPEERQRLEALRDAQAGITAAAAAAAAPVKGKPAKPDPKVQPSVVAAVNTSPATWL